MSDGLVRWELLIQYRDCPDLRLLPSAETHEGAVLHSPGKPVEILERRELAEWLAEGWEPVSVYTSLRTGDVRIAFKRAMRDQGV
jgi:hypothetical protein